MATIAELLHKFMPVIVAFFLAGALPRLRRDAAENMPKARSHAYHQMRWHASDARSRKERLPGAWYGWAAAASALELGRAGRYLLVSSGRGWRDHYRRGQYLAGQYKNRKAAREEAATTPDGDATTPPDMQAPDGVVSGAVDGATTPTTPAAHGSVVHPSNRYALANGQPEMTPELAQAIATRDSLWQKLPDGYKATRDLEAVRPGDIRVEEGRDGKRVVLDDWKIGVKDLPDGLYRSDDARRILGAYSTAELHDMAHGAGCNCPVRAAAEEQDAKPENTEEESKDATVLPFTGAAGKPAAESADGESHQPASGPGEGDHMPTETIETEFSSLETATQIADRLKETSAREVDEAAARVTALRGRLAAAETMSGSAASAGIKGPVMDRLVNHYEVLQGRLTRAQADHAHASDQLDHANALRESLRPHEDAADQLAATGGAAKETAWYGVSR